MPETYTMRMTLHLDGNMPDAPCPFAVMWLDAATRTWQREGYVGIDLPESGSLITDGAETLLCGAPQEAVLCALQGLDLQRPCSGAHGIALWYGTLAPGAQSGRWLIEHVDEREASTDIGQHRSVTTGER
jgi:hypothetical protein